MRPARQTWIALALCASAYLYAWPFFPELNNPNENVRLHMTAALVELHSYEIGAIRERWGRVNDTACVERRLGEPARACEGSSEGKRSYYSVKAPGTSLLGVPPYAVYRGLSHLLDRPTTQEGALFACRALSSILPMLVFLGFFHRWLSRRTLQASLANLSFFAVALGSLLYGYSLLFVSHSMSAASAFGAFMLLFNMRHPPPASRPHPFAAGLLTAGATFFEYPGLIVSIVLTIYAITALRGRRQWILFAAGGLIPTLAVMHFQWVAFDSPFSPGHLFVEATGLRKAHEEGFFGAADFHPEAAAGLLFSRTAGLFPLTPLLAFAAIGFPSLLSRRVLRVDGIVALTCVVLTYVTITFMNNWRGGWTVGPRYLATIVPFVGWGALEGLAWLHHRTPRLTIPLALGGAGAGIVASGLPSVYYPHLPPELELPLAQLFPVLLRHDYAPLNVGPFFGLFGTLAMIPLFTLWTIALGWAVWRGELVRWATQSLFGFALAALLAAPLFVHRGSSDDARPHLALITRSWNPKGHDVASRTLLGLEATSTPTKEQLERLAALYEGEGRDTEAAAVRLRAGPLERSSARPPAKRRGQEQRPSEEPTAVE